MPAPYRLMAGTPRSIPRVRSWARDLPERSESEADPVLLRLSPAVPRRLARPARREADRTRWGLHAHDPRRVRRLRARERRRPRSRARRARCPQVDRANARSAPNRLRRQARPHGPVSFLYLRRPADFASYQPRGRTDSWEVSPTNPRAGTSGGAGKRGRERL